MSDAHLFDQKDEEYWDGIISQHEYDQMTLEELRKELAILREEIRIAREGEGHWEMIADGIVFHDVEEVWEEGYRMNYDESVAFLEVRGNGQRIATGSMPKEDESETYLPENVRLFRFVVEKEQKTVVDKHLQDAEEFGTDATR